MTLAKTHFRLEDLMATVGTGSAQSALGPVCMTCGRVVDSEELVEGYPGGSTTAKVLVRHHGAEELRTFDMGSVEWTPEDLASYMRRANWFDPTSFLGIALGQARHPAADFAGEDPAPAGTAFSHIKLASER